MQNHCYCQTTETFRSRPGTSEVLLNGHSPLADATAGTVQQQQAVLFSNHPNSFSRKVRTKHRKNKPAEKVLNKDRARQITSPPLLFSLCTIIRNTYDFLNITFPRVRKHCHFPGMHMCLCFTTALLAYFFFFYHLRLFEQIVVYSAECTINPPSLLKD